MVAMGNFLHEMARAVESFVGFWAPLHRTGFQTVGTVGDLVASDDLQQFNDESLLFLF
jgi:hypothetical protein